MTPGEADIATATRLATAALLDVLDALGPAHHHALVLVGAQAVYLHVGRDALDIVQYTHDADLVFDPDLVASSPLITPALEGAGFTREPPPASSKSKQPGQFHKLIAGQWIEVDLLVPEAIAKQTHPNRRRSAGVEPHGRHSMTRAAGLEAALLDNAPREVRALTAGDTRSANIRVAGPAALLIAKAHKLGDRTLAGSRVDSKDALDIYRLLATCDINSTAQTMNELRASTAAPSVSIGIEHLERLFNAPIAEGSQLVGVAVGTAADPVLVRAHVSRLVAAVLKAGDQ